MPNYSKIVKEEKTLESKFMLEHSRVRQVSFSSLYSLTASVLIVHAVLGIGIDRVFRGGRARTRNNSGQISGSYKAPRRHGMEIVEIRIDQSLFH